MTCTECRDQMVEALYAELGGAAAEAFNNHLAGCAECRSMYLGMQQTLGAMNLRRRIEPGAEYWRDYWTTLRARLAPTAAKPGRSFRFHVLRPARMPAWAYGIAAVLLLASGVYLGRTFFTRPVQQETAPRVAAAAAPADSAETAALAYLGRTKNLLLGVVNLGGEHEAGVDLERRQQMSRQLLAQSSVITAALEKPDQQQLRQLIMDLEVVLLQLANVELKPGVPAVELVRTGVDRKSILLKINLEEMRAAARRTPPKEQKSKL